MSNYFICNLYWACSWLICNETIYCNFHVLFCNLSSRSALSHAINYSKYLRKKNIKCIYLIDLVQFYSQFWYVLQVLHKFSILGTSWTRLNIIEMEEPHNIYFKLIILTPSVHRYFTSIKRWIKPFVFMLQKTLTGQRADSPAI